MKRACIITNSPGIDLHVIRSQSALADLIIVADGAADTLPQGVEPQIICGDFDSIDRATAEKRFVGTEFIHNLCQETNDLEKCIAVAIERGAQELTIIGTLEGRIDQALTNFSLIEKYHTQLSVVFLTGDASCRTVSSAGPHATTHTFPTTAGDSISLIPRGDGATVTLSGTRWTLCEERLGPGSRGVGNQALGATVTLTVHQGVVLFVHGTG